MIKKLVFSSLPILLFIVFGCNKTEKPTEPIVAADKINIVTSDPDTLLVADSLTLFKVNVNYELNSTDSAIISIGFNTSDPNSYSMSSYADTTIKKGSGTCVLSALITPKNWGNGIPFVIFVGMTKAPITSTTYTNLVGNVKKIYSFKK